MKIGLISINAHTKVLNFASPLHTVAFQRFLKNNGIDATIIDYKPVYFGNYDVKHPLFQYVDHPDKDPKKQKNLLKKWRKLFYEREIRYDRFEEFIEKYYDKTDKCYTPKILDEEDAGFDCYICVTDVIWKWNPKNGFDKGFLLASKTMEGKKKIAYAASRGATKYSLSQKKLFIDYISDFDYISVRERSLKEYIDDTIQTPVSHVLDPVFLQPRSFYEEMAIVPPKKPEKKYILLYIVMEKNKDIVKAAVEYAQEHDMEVVELSDYPEDANYPEGTHHDVVYDIGVEEWLWYMLNAEYIITNSFHACCFSLIFEKQFFAGARSGDKIDSVLEMFGLNSRRVISDSELRSLGKAKPIDYDSVRVKIDEKISESGKFILDAIHDLEGREHRPIVSDPEALKERAEKNATWSELDADKQIEEGKDVKPEDESLFKKIMRKIRD